MAALSTSQVVKLWQDGLAATTVLYALRSVDAGDTIDLSADFYAIKRATMLGETIAGVAEAAVSAGTIITMPAGMNDDAAWLLAYGAHR